MKLASAQNLFTHALVNLLAFISPEAVDFTPTNSCTIDSEFYVVGFPMLDRDHIMGTYLVNKTHFENKAEL